MSKLIVTGDEINHTFVVYDLQKRKTDFIKPKQIELESEFANKGRPPFRPFGITSQNERIIIASNNRICAFNKKTYEFIERLNIPAYVNTHQIILDGDYIFVCNTSNDSIGIHNLRIQESRFLTFPDLVITNKVRTPEDAYELDNVHVNSLYKKGNLLYFCLHKKGNSSFGCLDLTSNKTEILFDAGIQSHNIRIIGNNLYSLSTATGDLIKVNLNDLKPIYYQIVDINKVFLRGMETYGNRLLIACSNRYDKPVILSNIKEFDPNTAPLTSHLLICDPEKSTIDHFMDIPEIKFITDIHLV
jgi:hypothetical protein